MFDKNPLKENNKIENASKDNQEPGQNSEEKEIQTKIEKKSSKQSSKQKRKIFLITKSVKAKEETKKIKTIKTRKILKLKSLGPKTKKNSSNPALISKKKKIKSKKDANPTNKCSVQEVSTKPTVIDLEKVIIEQPNNFDMNIPTGILDAEYAEKSDEYNIHSDEINNILSNKKKQLENWEDYVEKIRENFFI